MRHLSLLLIIWVLNGYPNQIRAQDLDAGSIFNQYSPCVVSVENALSYGTGFAIDDGRQVVTNYHVVEHIRRSDIYTKYSEEPIRGSVYKVDRENDLAILFLRGRQVDCDIDISINPEVNVGDRVISISNPLSYEQSLSDGIISGIRNIGSISSAIQTTASISSGSSGGPVFSTRGDIIGISTSTDIRGQLINFVVPVNHAYRLFKSDRLERGELYFYDLSFELLESAKLHVGRSNYSKAYEQIIRAGLEVIRNRDIDALSRGRILSIANVYKQGDYALANDRSISLMEDNMDKQFFVYFLGIASIVDRESSEVDAVIEILQESNEVVLTKLLKGFSDRVLQ